MSAQEWFWCGILMQLSFCQWELCGYYKDRQICSWGAWPLGVDWVHQEEVLLLQGKAWWHSLGGCCCKNGNKMKNIGWEKQWQWIMKDWELQDIVRSGVMKKKQVGGVQEEQAEISQMSRPKVKRKIQGWEIHAIADIMVGCCLDNEQSKLNIESNWIQIDL